MKKIILILLVGFAAGFKAQAQAPMADFDINILMAPPTLPLTNMGNLQISTCNNGDLDIVANSLRITITIGTNAEIMSLDPASDPRWTILSQTAGTNNTFTLKNTGGTMTKITGANPCANIILRVKATVTGGPSTITGTIGYIAAINPLLNPPIGAPNSSQGNLQTGNDNSTTSLIVTPNIVAPVTLINFTGKLVNNNHVDLDWLTAQEFNVKQYDVEHSVDGSTWSSLGIVLARGSTSYGLQDLHPADGRNFYRLRIVDIDGTIKYSNIVLINIRSKAGLVVYPSPSSDGNINVSIIGKGSKSIALSDYSGRQLKKWDKYDNSTLRIEGLPSGSYIISVTDIQTGERFVERFVVNR